MAQKSSNQINSELQDWKDNELDVKISNSAPTLFPNILNTVFEVLKTSIKDINDSTFNKVDGLSISSISGLVTALNNKENADITILKQANVVNNLLSNSATAPLSANQGRLLKDQLDALPSINSATLLAQSTANEISASELRTHVDNANLHYLQSSIDHTVIQNRGINSHAQIDAHIGDTTRHFQQGDIQHANIQGVGVNTHAQIDTHLSSLANPHNTNITQAVTASSLPVVKGQIYVANGVAVTSLPVGSNGQIIVANSATPSGLEWVAPSGEANTIQSLGSQTDLFIGKAGSNLQLRTLTSINNRLSINNNGNVTEFTINEGNIAHQSISGAGVNTHAQIDNHISNTNNPHNVTITQVSPATTKGDILVHDGANVIRVGVGSNGQTLVADSTTASGLRYSNDLITATSHTTTTNNPHDTTITQTVVEEGLPLSKGVIYVANGTSVTSLAPTLNGQVLALNSATLTGLEWVTPIGEANTASNITSTGVGFFDNKTSSDLRFRRLDSANPAITVTLNGNKVDLNLVPSNISHTTLSDAGSNTHVQIDNHIANTNNPHFVTKTQVGLGNVPNVDATNVDNHVSGATNAVFTQVNLTKLNGIATNATANAQQAALTASLTNLSQAGTFTPDFTIQALTNSSPWGFVTQDEAETVLSVIRNMQIRINELESRLQAANILV
jgi:hypothetical protein